MGTSQEALKQFSKGERILCAAVHQLRLQAGAACFHVDLVSQGAATPFRLGLRLID